MSSVPMTDEEMAADFADNPELEAIIAALIKRKDAAREGSAARRFYLRQIAGLRYSHADAQPLIEHYDPFGMGYC